MRVNLADGRTVQTSDVADIDQDRITGVLLDAAGVPASVSRPHGASVVSWSSSATETSERVDVQADAVRLTVVSYRSGMVRAEMRVTGTPRWLARGRKRSR